MHANYELKYYRIQPNYCTEHLGFSKFVEKYVPTYTKGTLKKKKVKDLSNNAYVMVFFFLIFFIKVYVMCIHLNYMTSQCNSNEYPQHMPL